MNTTTITPKATAQDIFEYLAQRHAYYEDSLGNSDRNLRDLPLPGSKRHRALHDQVRQALEENILVYKFAISELREAGCVALGIEQFDDEGTRLDPNPFEGVDVRP
jgi:hypothetical protein